MGKRKKRKYYDAFISVKKYNHLTSISREVVHSWEIEELFVNGREGEVNKKRRSRVGYLETRKKK